MLLIRNILVRIRIRRSLLLTYGSGSGSCSFFTSVAFKMPTKTSVFKGFFADYFLKILTVFKDEKSSGLRIRIHNTVPNIPINLTPFSTEVRYTSHLKSSGRHLCCINPKFWSAQLPGKLCIAGPVENMSRLLIEGVDFCEDSLCCSVPHLMQPQFRFYFKLAGLAIKKTTQKNPKNT